MKGEFQNIINKSPTGFSTMTSSIEYVDNYNSWILDEFQPYLGKDILEIGTGQGNFKRLLFNIYSNYVSIDIDVLDGAQAPGTGYTIPGGLTYRQLWNSLAAISHDLQVIGFDLVEVAPDLDTPSRLTQITAVKLIAEFMGFITEN